MDNEEQIKLKLAGMARKSNARTGHPEILIGHDSGNFGKLALTVDSFFESTHFPKAMPLKARGCSSVNACISDLVAFGASPQAILVSVVVGKSDTEEKLRLIYSGIIESCIKHKLGIIGGDTKKGNEFGLVITGIGRMNGKPIMRHRAGPGDLIFCSGTIGTAAIGLFGLLEKEKRAEKWKGILEKLGKGFRNRAVEIFNNPSIEPEYAKLLSRFSSSCCDVSDGFFFSLGLLIPDGKEQGAEILKLPIERELEKLDYRELRELFSIGQDYRLLFTVPGKNRKLFQKEAGKLGLRPIEIGKIVKGNTTIAWKGKRIEEKKKKGYDSFRGI